MLLVMGLLRILGKETNKYMIGRSFGAALSMVFPVTFLALGTLGCVWLWCLSMLDAFLHGCAATLV
jgi:hypothetical protein